MFKTRTTYVLLLLIAITIAGCNKVKEILDIKFDADFTVDLSVESSNTGLDKSTFNVEKTVDPLEDETVQQYIDNIKGWEVLQLDIKFNQVYPDFYLSDGIVKIAGNGREVSWNLNDQDIIDGKVIALGNENGEWNMLNEIMNQKEPFIVYFSGNAEPASSFVLQFIIKTKITANPL